MRRMDGWRIGLLWARLLWAMVLLVLAVGLPAGAATIYTAEGVAVGGAGYDIDVRSSGVAQADTGNVFDNPALGAHARGGGIASQYGAGAFAEMTVFWFGSSATTTGRGKVETDVVFAGPDTDQLLPVTLNLLVDGGYGGGYNDEQTSYRYIDLTVWLNGASATGRVGEYVADGVPSPILQGVLAPTGLACLEAGCAIQTATFYVPANTPLNFSMELIATAITGYGVATVSFENTLYFPLGQDVFNLPDGYTAEMPGLSVFNNRAVVPGGGGGEVPEPATLALVGAGLAAVVVTRRRRG